MNVQEVEEYHKATLETLEELISITPETTLDATLKKRILIMGNYPIPSESHEGVSSRLSISGCMSRMYQLHKTDKHNYRKGDIVIINLVSDQPVKRYVIEILERCTFEKDLDLPFYEDFSRVMKPYLDNGLIRILGLATERTYQKQTQLKRLVE